MIGMQSKKIERLSKSVKWSVRQLEFPRRKRVEAIYQFCGSHYAIGGNKKRIPVNFLKMAVDIYTRILAPHSPQAMISTKIKGLKPTAINIEYAVNQVPAEIKLSVTLRKYIVEALFSMGILKVGLHTTGEHLGHPYGSTFVDNVTMDDYFIDMSAKSTEQIQYEGNDYWMDYEDLMESDWADKGARSKIQPTEPTEVGVNGQDRAEGISTDETPTVYRDRIWLRDVWLPRDRQLVTYSVKDSEALRVIEWDGPDPGPYVKLGFSDVPGNLLPLAPVQIWRDLHELGNALFRKLANQGDSEKSVLGFGGGNGDSVEDFKNASDGDGIVYKGQEPKELRAGGVNSNTLAFYLQTRDLSSYFAGNLDSLGGLSAMSDTVGQDRLMSEASSAQLRDMSVKSVESFKEVMYAIAYYEFHDPIKERILEKEIPGTDIVVPTRFGPGDKRGEFNLYDLKINLYALQDNSPSAMLQKIGAIVDRYIIPLYPMIQQAGGTFDVQRLLEIVAKYSGVDEIGEIVQFMPPPTTAPSPSQSPPSGGATPPQGRSPSGMSREGASAVVQQQLLASQGDGRSRR